ncbi:MAG TPA: histidine kinase [Ardenticatenaceae bacterium]|jgi:two-component system sensor histidine kinase DegS
MNNSTDFLSRVQEYIEDTDAEFQRTQQDLREIDLHIRQSTAEVEQLAQRNAQLRSRVAAMESNLESYPRAEIRSLLNAERESQLRLFMMRSQVEHLQNRQRTLEKYVEELQRFLELSQYLPSADELAEQGAAAERRAGPSIAPTVSRIIEAQEEERQSLARNMHDGPAQSLTNLVLHAEIVERLFDSDPARAKQELGNLKSFANSTFQKVRDFIFELRPMMLDDLGLAPTLRRYLTTFEEKNRVAVHFQMTGQERRLAPTIEITLFRAVQELVNNAIRHAQATQIQVILDLQGEMATVIVEDNGTGGELSERSSHTRKLMTTGLAAIGERVEMLNGEVTFDSSVGRGTRVTIRVPVVLDSQTPIIA